jgi:hypothetical protein
MGRVKMEGISAHFQVGMCCKWGLCGQQERTWACGSKPPPPPCQTPPATLPYAMVDCTPAMLLQAWPWQVQGGTNVVPPQLHQQHVASPTIS